MKKSLLILGSGLFALGNTTNAQTWNQSNEPAINDYAIRYVVDSNASNLAGATGTGVTWDYSTVQGYNGNNKIVTVIANSNTTDFPSATNTLDIPGYMDGFYHYTGSDRIGDGFTMNFSGQAATVKYDSDPCKTLQFPFAYGDNFTDNFAGSLDAGTISGTLTGWTTVVADGTGTLKLEGGTNINVLRIHTTDTINANLGLGTAVIIRNQFDYMTTDSLFPVFTHSQTVVSSLVINTTVGVVLSAKNPSTVLSIDEMIAPTALSVFPNPSNGQFTVFTDNLTNASIEVVNALGQTVKSIVPTANSTTLSIEGQPAGMYFVKVKAGSSSKTEKLIIK